MYNLGADSLSWDIIDAKFYKGSLNTLKILWNILYVLVQSRLSGRGSPWVTNCWRLGRSFRQAPALLCSGTPLLLGTIDKKPIVVSYMQEFSTLFSPRYKQHGYSLHTAFPFLYQKSRIKNIDCFSLPPTPQISFNLQLIFSFFQCLAELLLHYFF